MKTSGALEVVLREEGDKIEVLEGSYFRGWAGRRSEREEVGDPGWRQPIAKRAMYVFFDVKTETLFSFSKRAFGTHKSFKIILITASSYTSPVNFLPPNWYHLSPYRVAQRYLAFSLHE